MPGKTADCLKKVKGQIKVKSKGECSLYSSKFCIIENRNPEKMRKYWDLATGLYAPVAIHTIGLPVLSFSCRVNFYRRSLFLILFPVWH